MAKGMVISGMDLQEALTMIKAMPDFTTNTDASILFIHRKINNGDVYFISNQQDKRVDFDASFLVIGKKPELWNPVTGTSRLLPAYTSSKNETTVPLVLEPNESAFIVFRVKTEMNIAKSNAINFSGTNTGAYNR